MSKNVFDISTELMSNAYPGPRHYFRPHTG